ncbi:ATP-dependent nuclease [Natronoarchaeum rubrum]|uniref:ATP-dependent nuclease n=1 Tax=Natronoarchaeum rubrum TaxID=755311 RepID=UPI002112EBC6|nr:AAA family ATPase [Natronoarchaeum rubrum]
MQLTEFHVETFKPIEEDGFESIEELSVLIGKNDAGKSSFLEAVRIFLEEKGKPEPNHFHMRDAEEIVFSGRFEGVPDELSEQVTDAVDTSDGTLRIVRKYSKNGERAPSRTTLLGEDEQETLGSGTIVEDGEDLNKVPSRERIWSYLPEPIYIPAERNISEQTKFKSDTWIDRLLSPLLNDSESLSAKRESLEEELQDEMGDLSDLIEGRLVSRMDSISEVEVDPGAIDLGKAFTPSITVKDHSTETSVPVGERGSGVGSMFVLSLVEAYRERHVDEGYFLLFEEPGVWLHPEAKREMLGSLKQIAQSGGQIMLSTHSPIFIDRRGHGELHLVQREDGKTSVRMVDEDYLSAVEELGARNSDILQSDFVIYTEGPSDASILRTIAREYVEDWERKNITIQHLGGTGNIQSCHPEDLEGINHNFCFLLDSDRRHEDAAPSDAVQQIRDDCRGLRAFVHILEKREIENYFSSTGINQTLGLEVGPDFVGGYDDIPEKLHSEIAETHIGEEGASVEERQCDACGSIAAPDAGRQYDKKRGAEIVEAMYEEGEEITELHGFLDRVTGRL